MEVSDDSWVRSSRPDDNYGGTYGLQVKDKSTDTRTTLIRFTVPSSLTTVSRATLTLHFRDKKGDTGTIFAKTIVGQPWNEESVTWQDTAFIEGANDLNPSGFPFTASTDSLSMDATDQVAYCVQHGISEFAVALVGSDMGDKRVRFWSKESGNGPELVVTP